MLICVSGLFFAREVRALTFEGQTDVPLTIVNFSEDQGGTAGAIGNRVILRGVRGVEDYDVANIGYVKSAIFGEAIGIWKCSNVVEGVCQDSSDIYLLDPNNTWDVGIGTDNPQAKFEVYDTGGSLAKIKTDGYIEVDGGIIPMTTGVGNIGTDTNRWGDIRMSGTLYDGGTTYYIDPNDTGTSAVFAGSITIGGDLTVSGASTNFRNAIKAVDGSGSLIDADLLDTKNLASASTVDTVVLRDTSGDINTRLFRSEYDTTNATINYIMTQIDTASNNYIRPSTPAQLKIALGLAAGGSGDIWVEKAGDTMTGPLTMSGTSANIALGSNYLSGDGGDEGVFVDSAGNVGIGITGPSGILHTSEATGGTASKIIFDDYSTTNAAASTIQLRKSASDTKGTKTATANGEALGAIIFQGVDSGSNFDYGAAIIATQNGATSTRVPTDLKLYTFQADGTSNNPQLVLHNDGNVGIGTTVPGYKLDVRGTGGFTGTVVVATPTASNHAATKGYVDGEVIGDTWITTQTCGTDYALQSVGKTTKTCINKIDYSDIAYDLSCTDCIGTTEISDSYVLNTSDSMSGDLTIIDDLFVNDFARIDALRVGTTSTDPGNGRIYVEDYGLFLGGVHVGGTSDPGTDNLIVDGNVGIGVTSPDTDYTLTVANGTDGAIKTFGKIEVSGITSGNTALDVGQGKISAGEMDPRYEIDEIVYATYAHSTTGLKEETIGKVELSQIRNPKSEILNKSKYSKSQIQNDYYQHTIDFDEAEVGSDLWLLREITAFGDDWNDLVVTLTPEGKANVWYEFIQEENKIIIYGDRLVKVSYRLVAPRFDWPERDTNLCNGTGKAPEGSAIFVR